MKKQANTLLILMLFCFFTAGEAEAQHIARTANSTFKNPILPSGPDPWIIKRKGMYYMTHTSGNKIVLYQSKTVSHMRDAAVVTIFVPPTTGPYSKNIWAPEMHFLNGRWYMYFAADDGDNKNHRMFVLENKADDPTTGTWEMKGQLRNKDDRWAIDGTVMEYDGKLYFIWSGWEQQVDGQQNLYIAQMNNPYELSTEQALISQPQYEWEKQGYPDVNEGPEILKSPKDQIFLIYSASHCSTDDYALGLLSLKVGGDPVNPLHWLKSEKPVFSKSPEQSVYGPGHNSFFKSADGKEDWILYHANEKSGQGCSGNRSPRMQKFGWNSVGFPDFGQPLSSSSVLSVPSGE